ncbi:MAG: SufD family Fe-S cluster assembly protein, partial [Alistipes sp.]
KCTHGATVGQMDTEALLYMRQRGLSELQARALQIEGFVSEVVSHCEIEPLRKALMAVVADKLHKI